MTTPDFGKTASDYSRHRQGFPDQLFDMAGELGVEFQGVNAVDLGTGTGSLARGMARRGASVIGIDPSVDLIEEAKRLDLEWGVSTQYVNATAETTGLESGAYEIVASGQSWWWFDSQAALVEAQRILKLGGAIIICSFDWLPLPGSVVELTERLIEEHNPDWHMGGGAGTHPEFVTDLESGGFHDIRSNHREIDTRYTKEAWRGRIRASAGVGASMTPEQVGTFDTELSDALDKFTSDDLISTPHAIYIAVGRKPDG